MTPIRVTVGDLVEMSPRTEGTVRRRMALRLIEAGYMPEIADELSTAPALAPSPPPEGHR